MKIGLTHLATATMIALGGCATGADPAMPLSGHPEARFSGATADQVSERIAAACIGRGFLVHRGTSETTCQAGDLARGTDDQSFRASQPGSDSFQLAQLVFAFTTVQEGQDVVVQEQTTFEMKSLVSGKQINGNGNRKSFQRFNAQVMDFLVGLGAKVG